MWYYLIKQIFLMHKLSLESVSNFIIIFLGQSENKIPFEFQKTHKCLTRNDLRNLTLPK